jgi:hypothetical protein
MADPKGASAGATPPRGRESLLISGLALVWVASFALVAQRVHGSESLVSVFWGALGGGLLSLAGVVLAVSGLRQERDRRLAWLGLALSLANLLAIGGGGLLILR